MVPSPVIFVCSSLIWQTVLDRYPRIVSVRSGCSVIYGFGSCSHRGGVMTGRSAPGYHLYRFPIAPSSLVCLTSPLSIPRDAPRRQSLPSQAIFDWFRILNWRATDEGLTRRRPWPFCLYSNRRTKVLRERLGRGIAGNHLGESVRCETFQNQFSSECVN